MRVRDEERRLNRCNETKTPNGKGVLRNPHIVALSDPCSPVTEEYRKLKSRVIKLTKKDGFQNVIMITSSLSAEGKSVTSLNLAITLAQEYSHSVLLIDADLRRPSLHRYLGITPTTGLSDCLADGLDLQDVIIKTDIPKLSFLSSGTMVQDPVELLASPAMRKLFDEVKHHYHDRYIIIDTPPILPFAETHVMSAHVDGVIFVVREGMTSMQNLREAFDILADAPVLGIVYNGVSRENLNGRYHSYYNYNGSYAEGIRKVIEKKHV
jgi:exopolysaccharide/PEP-CTERM locus tyrosine autokinase